MKFQLPDLPYEYNALEPFLDEATMKVHHDKHHAGYVEKLNAAIEQCNGCGEKTIEELLLSVSELPDHVRAAIINNGGGHANHTLYWEIMGPKAGGQPTGDLANAIEKTFESFDAFKKQFSEQAATRFGSGWAWLVLNEQGNLMVYSTQNQDSPVTKGHFPILCIDVWEHAYYLKYQNKRAEYIEQWWNVVNWDKVTELYSQYQS
jgi:Fe-Mn family superoxide dismutase